MKNLLKKVKDYKNDFTTYPLVFEGYKWYKPIIIMILGVIIYLILTTITTHVAIKSGMISRNVFNTIQYNSFSLATMEGIFTSILIILFVPSIFLSSKILKERPFSSYLSSIGGWRWDVFFKSFAICAAVYVIINGIYFLIDGAAFDNKFTLLTLVLAIIITPLQCFAEEYLCRGFFMQTLGSWFKVPVIAIILQALIFTVLHEYNPIGQVNVLIIGIVFGWIAWYTDGLEVSSAIHSINNLVVFLAIGFSLTNSTNEIQIFDFVFSIVLLFVSVAAIFLIDRKWNWIGLEREC